MINCVQTTAIPSHVRGVLPADAAVVSATIRNARGLSPDALTRATFAAYHDIRTQLNATQTGRHIVRMWNFVPGITELIAPDLERYMAFNAGRFDAMCEWYGGADALPRLAPAASAVGCGGDHAHVHAIALPEPGTAIQNPRQTPAMHYSEKFGPRPPCFARGTRLGEVLLISGTASITGEESIYLDDLAGQMRETILNLKTLVQTAFALDEGRSTPVRSLRVYLPDPSATQAVDDRLRDAFGDVQIEYVHAQLCRRELLVEIEGVAVVGR